MKIETIPMTPLEIFFDNMGLCGCMDTKEVIYLIRDYLRACEREGPDFERQKHLLCGESDWTPLAYFFVGQMENSGLTEHGTGIRCSWLTDKGREALAMMTNEAIEKMERTLNGEDDA